jgi:hypothetical protein
VSSGEGRGGVINYRRCINVVQKKFTKHVGVAIMLKISIREVHNEELHDLYPWPNRIRTTKSRRMKWAGHVALIGKRGMHIAFCKETQREID